MNYLYGKFSDEQIKKASSILHGQIHKLLIYKDKNVDDSTFTDDEAFEKYFRKLLVKFGGLNSLLGEPPELVMMMVTLQAAYNEAFKDDFDFSLYRGLILDAHNLLSSIIGEND